MADASEGDVVITTASDDAKPVEAVESDSATSTEVNDAEARMKELEAELNKTRDILEKARKGEKYAKQTKQQLEQRVAELESQGDWKAKYDQLVNQLNADAVDRALQEVVGKSALPEHKAAVLKLIDRSAVKVKDGVVDAESVEAAALKAREEFPGLHVAVTTPAPKRAAEGAVTGGVEQELKAAKTEAELHAVMKRYGLV